MAQVTPPADGAAPKKARTTGSPAAKAPAAKATTPMATAPKAPAAAKAPAAPKSPTVPRATAPKAAATAKAPATAKAAPAPPQSGIAPVPPIVAPLPTAPAATAVPPIPTPPAEGFYAPPVAPVPPGKRRIWPWVLGGGVLLFVLLIVGASVLVATVLKVVSASTSPSATVIAFDESYRNADCTLFKSTTTTAFRDSYFADAFTCSQWVDVANGLHDHGTYNYTVAIHSTTASGDTADVRTTEKDTTPGAEGTYELDYVLVKSNGGWLIDSINSVG